MGWTIPPTFSSLELVTAAELNEITGDLNDLDRRSSLIQNSVATSQTTTSTSYADLATTGPSVIVTAGANGGIVLVTLYAYMQNDTLNASCFVGASVSGATSVAATDDYALAMQASSANANMRLSAVFPVVLNAGNNTIKMQYRVSSGTGTFAIRRLGAVALSA